MTIVRVRTLIFGVLVVLGMTSAPCSAQADTVSEVLRRRISLLERHVDELESEVLAVRREMESARSPIEPAQDESYGSEGMVLFAIAGFCALWAQNTRRNPWLWFFLGLFFHVITLLFLLAKNVSDRRAREMEEHAAA
jgi:hypothetical protein